MLHDDVTFLRLVGLLATILTVFGGVVIGAVKLLANQITRRLEEQITTLKEALNVAQGHWDRHLDHVREMLQARLDMTDERHTLNESDLRALERDLLAYKTEATQTFVTQADALEKLGAIKVRLEKIAEYVQHQSRSSL